MKKSVISICAILIFNSLTSCSDDDFEARNPLPVRESHFDFETGVKLGEKVLTYNNEGNLVLEYYHDEMSSLEDMEIKYEYDFNSNLIRKIHKNPNVSDKSWGLVFTYENGLKISESGFYDGEKQGYQTRYFYSINILDSTRLYYFNTMQEDYKYLRTDFYEYDILDRVIKTYEKTGKGGTLYRYGQNKLVETCDFTTGIAEGSGLCIKNEYNNAGNLIKISMTSPSINKVQEELFYKGNVLVEKKIYTYPAYDPDNTIDIRLVKYEY